MSSDRNAQGRPPPVKPTLAARRTAGAPLTPRVAASATPTTTAGRTPTIRSHVPTATPRPRLPQVKVADTAQNNTINKDGDRNVNITPRSYVRTTRTESPSSVPASHTSGVSPNSIRGRPVVAAAGSTRERTGNVAGLGIGAGAHSRPRVGQARSMISDSGSSRGPLPVMRSPGNNDSGHSQADGADSRFFHASEATKQEPTVRKPEPKKPSVFFHADGSSEAHLAATRSPPVSTPLKRYSNPWPQHDTDQEPITSPPPLLSPTLSSVSLSSSPFFAPLSQLNEPRAPSPSKENIHLSYRRGASQIFGLRPIPVRSSRSIVEQQSPNEQRRVSLEIKPYQTSHRKSTSLSSIDSGNSVHSRRRSATTLDPSANASSPLSQEANFSDFPKIRKQSVDMPSIGASLELGEESGSHPHLEGPLSPSKSVSELAADARRERKVLDLEISNSSLLAINSSLEREVRRQKAELKRFRRLSRAGKFGFAPHERTARLSEGLSVLGEEDEDIEDFDFGGKSALREMDDDLSEDDEDDDDDETSSVTSGGDPLSPNARESKQEARLAKDEQRLRADISKHKELLVQSQMMNQSLKRCMYATEEMINEGKKALQYNVRVSDIRLGGRILTDHDHDDDDHGGHDDYRGHRDGDRDEDDHSVPDIEVEDDTLHGADMVGDHAKGFLDVWSSLGGGSFEGSEGGDRDSGIEVDKLSHTSASLGGYRIAHADNGRPPEGDVHWSQRR